jgi:hypothetical protein
MVEVINVYRQEMPAVRFIGKQYGDPDRVNGGFGAQWHEWMEKGWMAALEPLGAGLSKEVYPENDAFIGLMRWMEGEPFQYWIGIFTPAGTPVPEGYASVDFPASVLGVCWLRGQGGDIFGKEDVCAGKLKQAGHEIATDAAGAWWFFERYAQPRFTQPDAQGFQTLDICHYIKG